MNNFKKGMPGNRKGIINRRTMVKRLLKVEEIEDLKTTVLDNFAQLSKSKDTHIKLYATKEIAKYLFPQKIANTHSFEGDIKIVFENIKDKQEEAPKQEEATTTSGKDE